MPIALTDDRRELASVARSFLTDRDAIGAARSLLDAPRETLPSFWGELVSMGWLGLHIPEQYGGSGYTIEELAVVVEELGRVAAPGPFLSTVIASTAIEAAATDEQKSRLLPGLADGSTLVGVGICGEITRDASGVLSGRSGLVFGGETVNSYALAVGDDVVVLSAADVRIEFTRSLDRSSRVTRLDVNGAKVDAGNVITGAARVLRTAVRALVSAEAAGGAAACTDMAVEYAKLREQFGRTISYFQAVKHNCANMFVDAELAAAGAWDAARIGVVGDQAALTADLAATEAVPAYRRCAEKNIQVLGGIGFTWEHNAHLYLRRAAALNTFAGSDNTAAIDAYSLLESGVETHGGVTLPPEAEAFRVEAREFGATYRALPAEKRREALIESGYLMPHWPKPYGRGAGAIEQLVIDEELPDLLDADLGIGTWVLLTLIQHATPAQAERWILPSMRLDLRWCQLFSEPNAGSDAAAIQTKATRVDGGWLVNGQKVWTSGAQNCNRGLATVRTDPDAAKHAGVSTFAIDMTAKGVEIRPLREITGEALFNEVFFDDVFVPDDDVVGPVNQGWTVARATLGNERVSIGSNKGALDQIGVPDLIEAVRQVDAGNAAYQREAAQLAAEEHAMQALSLRNVMRAIIGGPPGPEGAVTKLLSAEHQQRTTTFVMKVAGDAAVSGDIERYGFRYLFAKCLSIAGGTSEITRNIISERILGMPRDPLAK